MFLISASVNSVIVAEANPLKQGLKLDVRKPTSFSLLVAEANPLKQGLKLSHKLAFPFRADRGCRG